MANIKQVAALAGLSVACVSKYLKNPDSVLPSSRERIEAAIEELQYTPSAMARYLRTKRTYTVKAVMESITIPFFAEMFETLRRDLEERGYTTILQTTDSRPFSTRDFDAVDGVIACFVDDEQVLAGIHQAAGGLPFICMHWREPFLPVPTVWLDVREGMRLAARHLLEGGCRRLAHVGGPPQSVIASVKEAGVRETLREAGLSLPPERCFRGEYAFQSGYAAAKAMAAMAQRPDGVICDNDVLAAGVICGFYRQEVAVPGQVRVTGFDNIPLAEMVIPALTSVALPMGEMCGKACGMLLQAIENQPVENTASAPFLVIRQS